MSHEDTRLMSAFYHFASQYPNASFEITSGDRTKQPGSGPYPIAPEGTSLHERFAYHGTPDEAIDVTVNGQPLGGLVSNATLLGFGIHVPFTNDPVHTELAGYNG